MGRRMRVRLAVWTAAAITATVPAVASADDPTPPFIGPNPEWLVAVNYFRAMAALPPVTEEPSFSAGAYLHSCYMLQNGITHYEVEGKPGYTVEGAAAGANGNVAVTSVFGETARRHIELWMTGPFHAVGVLRPNLLKTGFGKCDNQATSPWKSGGTLDVLRGLGRSTTQAAPIVFPGNGTTTNLNRFVAETPDPRDFCGWPRSGGGLPILALMPEPPVNAVATVSGPAGALETCTLTGANTSSTAKAILDGNNVVIAMPRNALDPGVYTVTVQTAARTVTWSFTVDPTAATAPATATATTPTTVPATTPSTTPDPVPTVPEEKAPPTEGSGFGDATGYEPVGPVRLVDTRENNPSGRLEAGVTRRFQIGGRGGIPVGAKAASANFTVTEAQGTGFLTVWNCSEERPVVATLNFGAGETVANAATVPLDSTGGICVYSTATAHLVVDANGFYRAEGTGRFTTITPARLMDTRFRIGPSDRISGGRTVELQVGGANGLPSGIEAAALNVASVDPGAAGFVTVYPCDAPRPWAASLNPVPGHVKPNLVIAPLSEDGKVCFYTSSDVDLVVDVTGYLSPKSTALFTPSQPFRFTDTREVARADVNQGTGGAPVAAGQVLRIPMAGLRGIPSKAKAISANIAVTGAEKPGFLTAFPCGERPNTANVNYTTVTAISNGAQLPLSSDGALCIYVMTSVHVVIDVNGWWS